MVINGRSGLGRVLEGREREAVGLVGFWTAFGPILARHRGFRELGWLGVGRGQALWELGSSVVGLGCCHNWVGVPSLG